MTLWRTMRPVVTQDYVCNLLPLIDLCLSKFHSTNGERLQRIHHQPVHRFYPAQLSW